MTHNDLNVVFCPPNPESRVAGAAVGSCDPGRCAEGQVAPLEPGGAGAGARCVTRSICLQVAPRTFCAPLK